MQAEPDLKSAQASRRAKRDQLASTRANDIEFATEIGQSLLTEVRRLQALLQERDEHIAEMSREKEGLAAALESKSIAMRSVEEAVGTFSLASFSSKKLTLFQTATRKRIGT
jgi:hypothetical protein